MKSSQRYRFSDSTFTQLLMVFFCIFTAGPATGETVGNYLEAAAAKLYSQEQPFVSAAGTYNSDNWILAYDDQNGRRKPYFTRISYVYEWTVHEWTVYYYLEMHNADHLFAIHGALEENYYHWLGIKRFPLKKPDFDHYQSLLTIYCDTLTGDGSRLLSSFDGARRGMSARPYEICRRWLDSILADNVFMANHYRGDGNPPVVLAPEWHMDSDNNLQTPVVSYRLNPLFYSDVSEALYFHQGRLTVKSSEATEVRLDRLVLNVWFWFPERFISGQNLKWAAVDATSAEGNTITFDDFGTNILQNAPYLLTAASGKQYLLFNTGSRLHVWQLGQPWSSSASRTVPYSKAAGGFQLTLENQSGHDAQQSPGL